MNRCIRTRRSVAATFAALLLLTGAGCTAPTVPTADELVSGVTRFVDGFGRGFLYGLATSVIRF